MKMIFLFVFVLSLQGCDDSGCKTFNVEGYSQSTEDTEGWTARDHCNYSDVQYCLITSVRYEDKNSLWRNEDNTSIRMDRTYESIEGWTNITREPFDAICADYSFLSDDYCSAFDGDYMQCLVEGCLPFGGKLVDFVNEECVFEDASFCVYDKEESDLDYGHRIACSDTTDDILLFEGNGPGTGWSLCDSFSQCIP